MVLVVMRLLATPLVAIGNDGISYSEQYMHENNRSMGHTSGNDKYLPPSQYLSRDWCCRAVTATVK